MQSQNDYQYLLVGKTGDVTTKAASIDALADGEVGVFTPGGTAITTGTAGEKFILAVGRGSAEPLVSEVINPSNVTATTSKTFSAKVEQLDYVGYNGSTGSIDVVNDTLYRIRLNINQSIQSNHGGVYVKDAQYNSDLSATQDEIASGLAASGILNFSREASDVIGFSAICNVAAGASNFDALGAVNGSTTITDTNSAGATVGNYFRIGVLASTTVTLTDDVYLVTGVDGDLITLNRPFQGDTGAYATTEVQEIDASTAATADWGVGLQGESEKFVTGKFYDKVVQWNTTLDEDFGDTPITNSVKAFPGVCTVNQTKELEFFCNGNNGEFFHVGEPNLFESVVMSTSSVDGYPQINISVDATKGDLTKHGNKKLFTVAVPDILGSSIVLE